MINRAQISRLLMPGIRAVFGDYKTYPAQWREIYKVYQSNKAQEIEIEMRYPGPADFKHEGQPVVVDTMGQRTVTNYIHKRVGLSFVITKEAMEDNLYPNQFPQQSIGLRESLMATKDILGTALLNNAFNPNALRGDGQPLCSVAHPIDGGTYANTFEGGVTADLTEMSLEEALIRIQAFPMVSGMLSQTKARRLIVPPKLQFTVGRLLKSEFRPTTANNDINMINSNGYFPEGYRVNQYLTSPSAWFILTDAPNGMKHYERTGVELDSHVDPDTDNIKWKATERYSFGCSNPRAIWGALGV